MSLFDEFKKYAKEKFGLDIIEATSKENAMTFEDLFGDSVISLDIEESLTFLYTKESFKTSGFEKKQLTYNDSKVLSVAA
jgi:acyl carrier protein